jgi:putative hemolysin
MHHKSELRLTSFNQCMNCLFTFAALLQENSRLGEELRTVTKQMERERSVFEAETRRLEMSSEELRSQLERAADERRAADEDHWQKIEALEKQLKSEKQFIEVGF